MRRGEWAAGDGVALISVKAGAGEPALSVAASQGAGRMPNPTFARTLRPSGIVLIGGALLSAEAAWLHMRELVQTYGVICGSGSGVLAHCPACYASVTLLAAGAAALILAQVDCPAAPVRARSSPSA
jgi:hypothetical protein